jgi:acetoin:2,6-dichlorophenolindophenol oxidoreductase subunit alpha
MIEEGLRMYRTMHLIRGVELAIQRLFLRGEVHGTTHLYVGQEAVATGVCAALRPDDYVAGTYRGHGHSLAKGVPANAMVAEMLGRVDGVCAGRSGSMNVTAIEHGLLGCYGIIGGSIAAATGGALSGKRQGRVAVTFFGDGSTNQAYFFECLNFAKVHRLPLVCICENNLYGEYTPMEQVTAGPGIVARGEAFGIASERVDGNDVFAVKEAAQAAVDRARAEHEPALLECMTYRQVGHSRSDPAKYRPEGELEAWIARDPLPAARARLAAAGVDADTLAGVEASAQREVDDAVEFALGSPFPEPTTAKEYCDAAA